MTTMNESVDIYPIAIRLLNEGVPVWVIADGRQVGDHTFLILDTTLPNDTEVWEFLPGEVVNCRRKSLNIGYDRVEEWVAYERVVHEADK